MSQPLVPCPACHRHVRIGESACPFCASALPDDLARRVIPSTNQRLSRGAAFAFASTLTLAGCSSSDQGGVVPLYGAPTDLDAASDGASNDADAGAIAIYGAPSDAFSPVDSESNDADTGAVALYGGAPDTGALDAAAPDAEPRDTGGGGAIYGSAPKPPDAGA